MSYPFSERTTAHLIEAIRDGYSDTNIGTLVLKSQASTWAPPSWKNKETRVQDLLQELSHDDAPEAERAALELSRLTLSHGKPRSQWSSPAKWYDDLRSSLEADGWHFDEAKDRLLPASPVRDVTPESNAILESLRRRGWDIAAGHFDQALDAYGRGAWASANGQLRSTLEDLVPRSAGRFGGSSGGTVENALGVLQSAGKLADGENNFVRGLWTMSHSGGAHAGLSDGEEARFRLLVTAAYLAYFLQRLD